MSCFAKYFSALSILAINLGNRRDQWTLIEKFHEVDVELQNSFGVCMPYQCLSRAVCAVIVVMSSFILFLLGITYHYLSYLEFPPFQIYFICLAISLSNYGLYTVFLQFKWSCQFLYRRFFYVNMLLQQLQFDQPISKYCKLAETKLTVKKNLVKEYGLWSPVTNLTVKKNLISENGLWTPVTKPTENGKRYSNNQLAVRQILVQNNAKNMSHNDVEEHGLRFLSVAFRERM